MKTAFKSLAIIAAVAIPLAAYAADTSQPQSSAPQAAVPVCPCMGMMNNGTMQSMHGAMMGNTKGGMMTVNATDWQNQQQEIKELRKEIQDLRDQAAKQKQ